jgi:hypothetical protein
MEEREAEKHRMAVAITGSIIFEKAAEQGRQGLENSGQTDERVTVTTK